MYRVNEEINEFFELFSFKDLSDFLQDVLPIFQLYDVDEKDDWVQTEIQGDKEEARVVRLIRTAYLFSRLAEFHAGKLLTIKMKHKDLWKRMEKEVMKTDE